ncbi:MULTISPECIES: hypothetical protein [Exiguobacterium]|uniref:hypothetical protein n=1 Tax=Exiguobacterium TaxID=33986 RepID=UPI000493DED7|nr:MULTISPECIES: hypothetical protein [Exiguobacterium]
MKWQVIRFRGGWIRYRIEPQIIRIDNRGKYHLGWKLFPYPNRYAFELAVLLKNKHRQRYKRPLLIKTASIATEIWGHTHLDLFYRVMLQVPLPRFLSNRYKERLRNTSIIDIGVRAVDTNRIVWDIGNRLGGWAVFRTIQKKHRK